MIVAKTFPLVKLAGSGWRCPVFSLNMKQRLLVPLFLLCAVFGWTQKIQTLVPAQNVIYGAAFQVQYVVSDPEELASIVSPSFDSMKLVSGPNQYRGSSVVNGKAQAIENITFTLVPTRIGTLRVPGLTARLKNGSSVRSEDAYIVVHPQPKASFSVRSSYTDVSLYAPTTPADLDALVRDNLFVRTEVDRKTVYIGEPVAVSFKLYSRLQSTSEVVNAPSLYGFSVMDVLDINEAHPGVETIGNKVFNTSVLRKLQLYPEQSGRLTIDPMVLENEIVFDQPGGAGKKLERLSSNTVEIEVRPLPNPRPADFTSGVGQFRISSRIEPAKPQTGKGGQLIVSLSGSGNFIQLGAPDISWPEGFDVFDSSVRDVLDKNAVPAAGRREFIFHFNSDSIGHYHMDPVRFSYFDPVAKRYKSIASDPLDIELLPGPGKPEAQHAEKSAGQQRAWWALMLLPLLAAIGLFLRRKKPAPPPPPAEKGPGYANRIRSLNAGAMSGRELCAEVQKILTEAQRSGRASGSGWQDEYRALRSECEQIIYSSADLPAKEGLKERALELLHKMGF